MKPQLADIIKYIGKVDKKELKPTKSFMFKLLHTKWKQSDFTEAELSIFHLDLQGTNISKLPDNLTIRHDLILSGSTIYKLPNNLKVGSDISYFDIPIQKIKLPDDLIIHGYIYVGDVYDDYEVNTMKKLNPKFADKIR